MNQKDVTNFNVDSDKLLANINAFKQLGSVYYPLKPNADVEILNELIDLSDGDLGFLVTYLSHFNKLIELGINPDKIGVINVLLDDESIKYLYDNGVRFFTFHNINQVINFSKYADLKKCKINVRLSICEPFKQFSHLGGNTEECKKMIALLNQLGCTNYGISFYLQKEITNAPNCLETMLDYISNNFAGYGMKFINIGGSKKPEELDRTKLDQVKQTLGIENFVLEPGRYLVGNAVEMETSIIETKTIANRPCIIIKNGIYSGLVDTLLYQKQFEYCLKTNEGLIRFELQPSEDVNYEFIMCGGSSDSGDRLGRFYINEKYKNLLKTGATLVIPNAGCYVAEFFMALGGDLTKQYNFNNQLDKNLSDLIEKYDALNGNHQISELINNSNRSANQDYSKLQEFMQKLLGLKMQCIERIESLNMNEFANKTVLVTGGSSGIGKSIVDLYLKAGAKVIVFDIQECPDHANRVEYHKVDVRNKTQIQEALATTDNLDILVTCAGVFDFDANMDEEKRQRMVDVNIHGVKNMCDLCMPLLKQRHGQICTITSGLAKTIDPSSLLYCITKQEIIKLTEAYASQYEETQVRVNSVLPGPIMTPLLVNAIPTIEDLIGYGNLNPKNMIGLPEWVALEVLRVTSNNHYNNYQSTEVDCGEVSMSGIENNQYWIPGDYGDYSFNIGGKEYKWDSPYSLEQIKAHRL